MLGTELPDLAAIVAARARIAGHAVRTPVLRHPLVDELAGAEVHLKCESLQLSGSFKARGALNAVLGLDDAQAARGVAAHSSGNHGGALAIAARLRGIPAYIVVPSDTPAAKRRAITDAGGVLVECPPTMAARAERLAEVVAETGAHEVHPYDDPRVIAGAGTAALELLEDVPDLDVVVAPVSGGGLLSGTAIAVAGAAPGCAVWAVEPAGVDDAYQSFLAGRRVVPPATGTIADGLRAELCDRTFAAIQRHVTGIVTVTDDEIVAAMAVLFSHVKLVVEAGGATALAGVRHLPVPRPRRVGVLVSGGNLDLEHLPFLGR